MSVPLILSPRRSAVAGRSLLQAARAIACLFAGCLALGAAQAAPFDITFVLTGDPHYKAFDTVASTGASTNNPNVRANLTKLKNTVGQALPSPYNAVTIGTPSGLIVAGDLIDGGSETDPATGTSYSVYNAMVKGWANFIADFGLTGTETGTRIDFPAYEGYGNHDQNGFWKTNSTVQNILDKIAGRNLTRPAVTAVSGTFQYSGAYSNATATGVHYAWKWGPFHFIQTSVRVGDSQSRYPCAGSLTFVQNYLQNVVGTSGEPVFIIHHLPPSSPDGDWPVTDQRAYYNAIKDYNIAGILVAHTHGFGDYTWSGPDANPPKTFRVYQVDSLAHTGSTQGIGTFFRLYNDPDDPAKAVLIAAQRKRDGTWGTTVKRSIPIPYTATPPGVLSVTGWSSVNTHNATACALNVADDSFIEPRQGGVRRVEVDFSEAISFSNAAAAVTISGVNSSGAVTPTALGVTPVVSGSGTTKLVVTFTSGGNAAALPDAAKWRFTLNPSAISAVSGSTFAASANTTRVISGLKGDINSNGRVSGVDLSQMHNSPVFNSALTKCLRSDVDGSGAINTADKTAAWTNRGASILSLASP